MRLICDDLMEVYYWVSDNDENEELSPHFDYEDDALLWKERLKKELYKESD
jgi:hypothetical protein